MKYRERLVELVLNNDELMEILKLVRSMELKEWAIGAGILRDLVWHKLNQVDKLDYRDIDVAYFDLDGMIGEEAEVERKLSEAMPDVPWDVKNQANVHNWYEGKFGFKVKPLDSITEAVSTWPETAVCVAISLSEEDEIIVYAPYGLDDLFEMKLRWNPKRIPIKEFWRRLEDKSLEKKWPKMEVIKSYEQ